MPEPGRQATMEFANMKTPVAILLCAASLSLAALLAGCDAGPTPPVGKQCTIQFRRDALGTAASLPVPPLSDNINGADTSISGTLKSTGGEWVVIDCHGLEVWVPKTTILLIKY
jgi:hypothetical protein